MIINKLHDFIYQKNWSNPERFNVASINSHCDTGIFSNYYSFNL